MFRVIIIAFQFWHSEPSSLLSFNIQSYHFFSVLAFRATIFSQFRHSEPPPLLSLGVQSHHLFSVWAFRATISLQLGAQSRHIFSVMTFRVILLNYVFRSTISLLVQRLEPHLHFGVQSRCLFQFDIQSLVFSLTFRSSSLVFSVINFFLVRRSEPCLQFGIQSHHVFLQLGVQIHHISFISAFRVVSSFWHSEPLFSLAFRYAFLVWHLESSFRVRHSGPLVSLAFKAIIFLVQHLEPLVNLAFRCHHISSVWHLETLVSLAFRATIFLQFSVQSRIPSIQSCHSLLVRCSESHCQHLELSFSFSLAFRFIFFTLDVQSPKLTTQSRSFYL